MHQSGMTNGCAVGKFWPILLSCPHSSSVIDRHCLATDQRNFSTWATPSGAFVGWFSWAIGAAAMTRDATRDSTSTVDWSAPAVLGSAGKGRHYSRSVLVARSIRRRQGFAAVPDALTPGGWGPIANSLQRPGPLSWSRAQRAPKNCEAPARIE